jgi:hypothetical protein
MVHFATANPAYLDKADAAVIHAALTTSKPLSSFKF